MDNQVINDSMLLPDEHLTAWRVMKLNGREADTHSNIGDEESRGVTGEQRLKPLSGRGSRSGF
jgi:hypothetical protein